ncbi:MAG: hypothetical protein RBJ76_02510 [Stenomitos frigidus ULC029]
MKPLINHNFLNHSHAFILSGIALLIGIAPAHALPGQNLKTVRQWAKESFVLPPALVYNPQYDAYTGIRTIEGGLLALYVKVRPQDQVSVQEQIVTQLNAPKLNFARNDAEGLKFIERLYTPAIADDFRTSKYVAQIGETDFYQGKKFIYTTLQQQGIRRFSLLPLSGLNQAIQRQVACQNKRCVLYQPFNPPKGEAGL